MNKSHQSGGNAHDRRKQRRALERIWDKTFPKFQPGEVVRVTSGCYGARYEGTKVEVLGKGEGYGTYLCLSSRRKSPLKIHGDHLAKLEDKKAA